MITLGPPGLSPHLKVLNLITSAKFFLLCKEIFIHRFQGLGHGHLWGPMILPTTDTERNLDFILIVINSHWIDLKQKSDMSWVIFLRVNSP